MIFHHRANFLCFTGLEIFIRVPCLWFNICREGVPHISKEIRVRNNKKAVAGLSFISVELWYFFKVFSPRSMFWICYWLSDLMSSYNVLAIISVYLYSDALISIKCYFECSSAIKFALQSWELGLNPWLRFWKREIMPYPHTIYISSLLWMGFGLAHVLRGYWLK